MHAYVGEIAHTIIYIKMINYIIMGYKTTVREKYFFLKLE